MKKAYQSGYGFINLDRTKEIKERNRQRKEFKAKKAEAIEMLHQIERELLNQSFGEYCVGDMNREVAQIKEIHDRLTKQGEYAE